MAMLCMTQMSLLHPVAFVFDGFGHTGRASLLCTLNEHVLPAGVCNIAIDIICWSTAGWLWRRVLGSILPQQG